MAMIAGGKDRGKQVMDSGKYARYTPDQVEALERVYNECPKPSSSKRQQLIRECPILSKIEPKQMKVWFQNRRCREKQRKEASRLQMVNRKLTAMNKLLMEENDRLQKQVSHLVYDNGRMHQQLQNASIANDTTCESMISSGQLMQQQNQTLQPPSSDANSPASLLAIAEETLAEFLDKATGTAVKWVQMVGMKPGPDSIGIVSVSHSCSGVAARAYGLVNLEPAKVMEILKDRLTWYRDCRSLDVRTAFTTAKGGNIEFLYMQTYAPTTLARARDFWTLRYSTSLEDGSLVVCERSMTSTGGLAGPTNSNFIRAEMLPSGYLIRACEGGGAMIHIVDHVNLDTSSVPEILRQLYESPRILAQKMTVAAFRHIRQIACETSGEVSIDTGNQPAVLRSFAQRLSRSFNDAINGFPDDGWSFLEFDGVDDVTLYINLSPSKLFGSHSSLSSLVGGVLCAKASMLLQNVPPASLIRFLREHRSEWANSGIDAYSAASLRGTPYTVPGFINSSSGSFNQVIIPLAHTVENEEFLEVVRLESHAFRQDDVLLGDVYQLQLCEGIDEDAVSSCAQLVFAPMDQSFSCDTPLLPSGFRVMPLDFKALISITFYVIQDSTASRKTLDLASTLEGDSGGATRIAGNTDSTDTRSVLTIAFQFIFKNYVRESSATMAREYVRSVVASVQRVAMAITPSRVGVELGVNHSVGFPQADILARWVLSSYR
ncbi:Homeobox-leucine zipper protein HOX32 [Platanthera guangdongensis]|uniref:Homeobox-leucine zipper protein HOX32 n=1 Tax=Platanthera guangdongensis TaxID=2320717 RepID=A0ABR2MGZ2_9ASPA